MGEKIIITVPTYGFVYENVAEPGSGQIIMSNVGTRYYEHQLNDRQKLVLVLHLRHASTAPGNWRELPNIKVDGGERIFVMSAGLLERIDFEDGTEWVETEEFPLNRIEIN